MKKIIVISRCVKNHGMVADFGFQGCYLGHVVKGLSLYGKTDFLQPQEDYVLEVEVKKICGSRLWGEILSYREVFI